MKKIELSPRLETIFNYAKSAKNVADVGCDHGKISVSLAKAGVYVHAIDISNVSLEKTRVSSKEHDVAEQISYYCSDGLEDVKNVDLDAVIMAGIGELTLIHIISSNLDCARDAKKLILQPMDGTRRIREYLSSNSFKIDDEKLVWDEGRLYTVIVASNGESSELSDVELLLGAKIISKPDELLGDLIKKQVNIRKKILLGLEKAQKNNKQEIKNIKKEIEMIKGVQR